MRKEKSKTVEGVKEMPTKLIPQKDLALIIGVSDNALHVYLSHYTLFKFVKYKHKKVEGKRIRLKYFVLTRESIKALSDYLDIKRMVNKKIKANAIEKLKIYYTSFDVIKNEN